MTKNKPKNSTENDLATNKKDSPPKLSVRSQYVKDLSFETPNAGKQFQAESTPKIDISISVNGEPAPDNGHEVQLNITAKATVSEELLFLVELV